jgi:hypothetical protein
MTCPKKTRSASRRVPFGSTIKINKDNGWRGSFRNTKFITITKIRYVRNFKVFAKNSVGRVSHLCVLSFSSTLLLYYYFSDPRCMVPDHEGSQGQRYATQRAHQGHLRLGGYIIENEKDPVDGYRTILQGHYLDFRSLALSIGRLALLLRRSQNLTHHHNGPDPHCKIYAYLVSEGQVA